MVNTDRTQVDTEPSEGPYMLLLESALSAQTLWPGCYRKNTPPECVPNSHYPFCVEPPAVPGRVASDVDSCSQLHFIGVACDFLQ
jgi:hypothetical protein